MGRWEDGDIENLPVSRPESPAAARFMALVDVEIMRTVLEMRVVWMGLFCGVSKMVRWDEMISCVCVCVCVYVSVRYVCVYDRERKGLRDG